MSEQAAWISLDDYCERYGERPNTVHKRVTLGHWHRGLEVSTPDGGTTFVNVARVDAWLQQRGKIKS